MSRLCLHLSERDARRREVRIVLDHVRQLGCRFPGHGAGSKRAQGPKALAEQCVVAVKILQRRKSDVFTAAGGQEAMDSSEVARRIARESRVRES